MIPIFGDLSDEHLAQIAGFPTQPLLLCSGGGSSDLARAIYGLLTAYPRPVIALGEVGSSALGILALGQKGERYALPYAKFMVHNPYTEIGSACLEEAYAQAFELRRFKTDLLQALSSGTGRDWAPLVPERGDFWFDGRQAADWGLVDHVESDPEVLNGLLYPGHPTLDPEYGEDDGQDLYQ
jgi:ATP-dependent Clp protease protease subunit